LPLEVAALVDALEVVPALAEAAVAALDVAVEEPPVEPAEVVPAEEADFAATA
jgi:hypothetical protein